MKNYPDALGTQVDNVLVTPARNNRRQRRTRRQCADWDRGSRKPEGHEPPGAPAGGAPASRDFNPAKVATATEALDEGRLRVNTQAVADRMLSGALAELRKYS